MTDTANWPIQSFAVVDLSLDVENVRLRGVAPYEADVLAYLYDEEDVLGLAKDIVRDGFFEVDLPIVTVEGETNVVLEGNRRVSALKGLANPTVVPRFNKQLALLRSELTDEALKALESVRAIVAPDRGSAQPIIAVIHTQDSRHSWPLDQQAEFFHGQLQGGKTIKQLQEEFPAVAEKIPRFIRMAEMYGVVKDATIPDDELREFADSKKFKMTTFERLYASPKFLEIAGLAFTSGNRIKRTGKKKDVDAVIQQVVQDVRDNSINTRVLGSQEDQGFTDYLDKLSKVKSENKSTPKKEPAKPAKKARSSKLDDSLEVTLKSKGTLRRLAELQDLNYRKFPNATFDLWRTVLECALKEYFEEIGEPVPRPTRGNKVVTLSHALDHALEHFKKDKSLRTVITKLKASPKDEAQLQTSAELLNAANHDPSVFIEPDQVLTAWDTSIPLLKVLLSPKTDGAKGDSD